MDARLQHDPRTKQEIKDALYSFLYGPIEKQFKQQLNALLTKNAILLGNTNYCFSYKGTLYSQENQVVLRNVNKLIPQLHSAMDEYLKELKQLNSEELPYVVGFINQVLNSSNSLQDYLKILPDAVHHPIEHLVSTCPCRTTALSLENIQAIQLKNQNSIDLMKKRMVTNLLI